MFRSALVTGGASGIGAATVTLLEQEGTEVALAAARSEETGQAWVVQPGREPLVYEFRGVPGPR